MVAANERKAASENAKAQKKNAIKETMEQEEWAAGAKDSSRKAVEEQKRLEKLAKKAERLGVFFKSVFFLFKFTAEKHY